MTLLDELRAEAAAYSAHADDHEQGMAKLLTRAGNEIQKMRAVLTAVMNVETVEPTGDPYDPASWAAVGSYVVAGSEHDRIRNQLAREQDAHLETRHAIGDYISCLGNKYEGETREETERRQLETLTRFSAHRPAVSASESAD